MQKLSDAIRSGSPEPGWVDGMRRKYPFFTIPMAMELARCDDDDARRRMLLRLRLAAPSSSAMEHLAGMVDPRFASFYPPAVKPHTPDTSTAIDDFLARYATTSPEEEALLEKMIFNPVPDYAQQLARQAQDDLPEAPAPDADSQDARISRFILSERSRGQDDSSGPTSPTGTPTQPEPPRHTTRRRPATPEPAENSLLSESLAKIYIKSHKYERAFEILSRLSLEFPEKSRYFADQLRFLRKLIINEQYRNKNTTPPSGADSNGNI